MTDSATRINSFLKEEAYMREYLGQQELEVGPMKEWIVSVISPTKYYHKRVILSNQIPSCVTNWDKDHYSRMYIESLKTECSIPSMVQ